MMPYVVGEVHTLALLIKIVVWFLAMRWILSI